MDIILSGEKIKLSLTFENLEKVENSSVGSIFGLSYKVQTRTAKLTDIVNLYYFAQDGTAHSQRAISDKILADGLGEHLSQVMNVCARVLAGSKYQDSVKKNEEKLSQ